MSGKEFDHPEMAKFDPVFTEMATNVVAPVIKRWFRSEVRGWIPFPCGRCVGGVVTTPAVYQHLSDRKSGDNRTILADSGRSW